MRQVGAYRDMSEKCDTTFRIRGPDRALVATSAAAQFRGEILLRAIAPHIRATTFVKQVAQPTLSKALVLELLEEVLPRDHPSSAGRCLTA